jgi:hypothetical protein
MEASGATKSERRRRRRRRRTYDAAGEDTMLAADANRHVAN